MHSAVLQNKKYIKFASENTVEVMALGSLDDGVAKKFLIDPHCVLKNT